MANKKDEEKKAEETQPEAPQETVLEQTAQPAQEPAGAPLAEETAPEEVIVKRGFGRVKIPGFRGTFKDAKFDDNGVCEQISQETFDELVQQFPKAEITDVEGLE